MYASALARHVLVNRYPTPSIETDRILGCQPLRAEYGNDLAVRIFRFLHVDLLRIDYEKISHSTSIIYWGDYLTICLLWGR